MCHSHAGISISVIFVVCWYFVCAQALHLGRMSMRGGSRSFQVSKDTFGRGGQADVAFKLDGQCAAVFTCSLFFSGVLKQSKDTFQSYRF